MAAEIQNESDLFLLSGSSSTMPTARNSDGTDLMNSITFSSSQDSQSFSMNNTFSETMGSPIIAQPTSLSLVGFSPINNVSLCSFTLSESYVNFRMHHTDLFVPETQMDSISVHNDTTMGNSGATKSQTVSDETLLGNSCAASDCSQLDTQEMIRCSTCKSQRHYKCTSLPHYQLYAFISTNRKFECIECVCIPADALPTLPQKPQSSHKDTQPVIDHVSECATPQQVQPDAVSNAIERLKISLVANFKAFKSLETTLVQATSDARNELLEKRLESLSLELELVKNDKTHLEWELGMARKAMHESKQQLNPENCQRCHALGDANKTAAENLRQSAQKQINLETLVDSLRTDIAKANSELDSSKPNSDSLARNLNTAIESKHEAETKISELERRVRLEQQEVSDLNDQLHYASAKIAELEADLQNEQKQTAALNKRLRDQALLPKTSQNPSASAPSHSPNQTAAQAFPPMDNQNPTAKTSQNHAVVDFLIMGNSNTSHIKPWRIFGHSKTTRVVTLKNKTIEGATDFVDGCDLKPHVVVLRVAGNNLAQSTSLVEDSVDKMNRLIDNCQTKFLGASILVGQPLPQMLRTAKPRNSTKTKLMNSLDNLANMSSNFQHYLRSLQNYSRKMGFISGLAELVASYSRTRKLSLVSWESNTTHPTAANISRNKTATTTGNNILNKTMLQPYRTLKSSSDF